MSTFTKLSRPRSAVRVHKLRLLEAEKTTVVVDAYQMVGRPPGSAERQEARLRALARLAKERQLSVAKKKLLRMTYRNELRAYKKRQLAGKHFDDTKSAVHLTRAVELVHPASATLKFVGFGSDVPLTISGPDAEEFVRVVEQFRVKGAKTRIGKPQVGLPSSATVQPETGQTQEPSGLKGAISRGEATKVTWVRDGTLVEAKLLADVWGLPTQALGTAARRGELFSLKVRNRLYYPGMFQSLERDTVTRICRALGTLEPSGKLIFWLRTHGALKGRTIQDALSAGVSVERVEQLADAWARERGMACESSDT